MTAVIVTLPTPPGDATRAWEARQAAFDAWHREPGEATRAGLIAATRQFCRIMNLPAADTAETIETVARQIRQTITGQAA